MPHQKFYLTQTFGLIAVLLFFTACGSQTGGNESETSQPVVTLKETFFTERDEKDNVDSPAIWNHSDSVNWIISTAKETDVLLIHDASTGEFISRACTSGTGMGELDRPNGVAVIDDMAIVVERNNHRVQVFGLPDFNSLGAIGFEHLIKPYGLSVLKSSDGSYNLYVTDNYETATEEIPADSLLGKRVHHYQFSVLNDKVEWKLVRTFGATEGEGILKTVESLVADPFYNTLLISDETETEKNIKVYSLDGVFTGSLVGDGLFKYEPEGIALYQSSDSTGYWICTDQSHTENLFHVFDRKTLTHLGTFMGEGTKNTDGVALSQYAFGDFSQGAFYPVHDDGNVSAISWKTIADSLNLEQLQIYTYQ